MLRIIKYRPREKSKQTTPTATSFNSVPQDDETTEDEPEPWVDCVVCTTHKADDLLAARGITPRILRQKNVLETSQNDCHTPRRPLDKAHFKVEYSHINQTERISETQGRPSQHVGRHELLCTTQKSARRQQRSHKRPDLAHYGTRQLEVGLHGERFWRVADSEESRKTHDHERHVNSNRTNNNSTSNTDERNPRRRRRRHTAHPHPKN